MALAFKRAVDECTKAVTQATGTIKSTYKATSETPLVIDFDGIKTIEGVSKQNPGNAEGPKNITCVNWVKDNLGHMNSIWADVQYKDPKNALAIMHAHIDKVVIHVDDKSNGKKYNSYDAKFEGKTFHITVHLDFDNAPQRFSMSDDKNGVHLFYALWDHLDAVANLSYQLEKAKFEASGELTNAKKNIDAKVKKDVKLVIHWEEIIALTGKAVEYGNKPPVPINYYAIKFFTEARGLNTSVNAITTLCKDQMSVEAFNETFNEVHLHVLANSKEPKSGPYKVTKNGKELHFHYDVNFNVNLQNSFPDANKLAKEIEALL